MIEWGRSEDGPGPATAVSVDARGDSSADVKDGAEGLELDALLSSVCHLDVRWVTHGPVSELWFRFKLYGLARYVGAEVPLECSITGLRCESRFAPLTAHSLVD
jgi:hypothetical protein